MTRDSTNVRALGFPVFARGTLLCGRPQPCDGRRHERAGDDWRPGRVDPGDLVFADADGVVVIPKKVEREVIDLAMETIFKESRITRDIAANVPASGILRTRSARSDVSGRRPWRRFGIGTPASAVSSSAPRPRSRGSICRRSAGEQAFSVNRGYLAARLGLPTSPYYVMSDPLTYRPYAEEVRRATRGHSASTAPTSATCPRIATRPTAKPPSASRSTPRPRWTRDHFAEDALTGIYRGFTVVLDAVQLAFMMGFAQVYIIGCDLDYEGADTHVYGTGATEQTRRGDADCPRAAGDGDCRSRLSTTRTRAGQRGRGRTPRYDSSRRVRVAFLTDIARAATVSIVSTMTNPAVSHTITVRPR